MSKLAIATTVITAVLLGACGGSAPPKSATPAKPVERGVYISAADCAEGGMLTAEKCEKVVDEAVAHHETDAPIFKTIRQCEVATGAERCDKTVDGQARPRLQAFFVVMSDPPAAVPLYPTPKNEIGFRSPSKQIINALDDTLHVSAAAVTLAHENSKLPGPEASVAVGAAAADIH